MSSMVKVTIKHLTFLMFVYNALEALRFDSFKHRVIEEEISVDVLILI